MSGVLRVTLVVCCVLCVAGESIRRRRNRISRHTQVLRLGILNLGCTILTDEEADRVERGRGATGLDQRIGGGSRRTGSPAPPRFSVPRGRPADEYCPSGVTYFDGCNSCSCGADKLCTLKACNHDTTVDIFDPCRSVTCGYHQRCQAICVGQLCRIKPLCVSDDQPLCSNCPWLCVDERLNCSDSISSAICKPTLACYRRSP